MLCKTYGNYLIICQYQCREMVIILQIRAKPSQKVEPDDPMHGP